MRKVLTLFLAASLAVSCEYEDMSLDEEVLDEEINHSIVGTWLLVETGYSPGDKYYKVPVSADPPKTTTFRSDFTMSTSNLSFNGYKYYRLLYDTAIDRHVIAFFEEDPGNGPIELPGLTPAYNIFWNGNYLNLNYRWCFEGCHQKYKRISPVESSD